MILFFHGYLEPENYVDLWVQDGYRLISGLPRKLTIKLLADTDPKNRKI